ncbi:MAG: hypothetical protein ACREF6_12640, partial [Alphaproteobacteria bacterium]
MFTFLSDREVKWLESATAEMKTVAPRHELVSPESVGNVFVVCETVSGMRQRERIEREARAAKQGDESE